MGSRLQPVTRLKARLHPRLLGDLDPPAPLMGDLDPPAPLMGGMDSIRPGRRRRPGRGGFSRNFKRQAGFANAAGANQGQQPAWGLGEQLGDPGQFVVAPQEGGGGR